MTKGNEADAYYVSQSLTSSRQLLILDVSICRWHIHTNVGADRQGMVERRMAIALKTATTATKRYAITGSTIATTTITTSAVQTSWLSFCCCLFNSHSLLVENVVKAVLA